MTFDGPIGADASELEPRAHERFSPPFRLPYHLGLYLAINAIPGSFAVIDGPDCLYRKAEWIHGRHDLRSTLLDATGRHRVVPTFLHSGEVITAKGDEVVKRIRKVASLPEAELVLVNTMPHVQIIGTQYDQRIAELEGEVTQPIYEVPSRALDGDYLTGYAEVLTTLARRIPLAERRAGTVALLGLFYDRNEGEGPGNVAELERMLAATGLEPISTWLSGRPFAHLCAAAQAEWIVALPHGVEAARVLAKRSGAKVIEIPQPFGLPATLAGLRMLGRALAREDAIERFIDAELRRVLPSFEWLIPSVLLGRTLVFAGDPTLFEGLLAGVRELGMDVVLLAAPARRPRHGLAFAGEGPLPPIAFAPPEATLRRVLDQRCGEIDLVVANTEFHGSGRAGRFEFGFPCFFRHALVEQPYLGIGGWAWFVQEISTCLLSRMRRADSMPTT